MLHISVSYIYLIPKYTYNGIKRSSQGHAQAYYIKVTY
jgi:hypothetical protein